MNYFRPNWYQINKAINEGNIKDLRKEQRDLEKSIQKKVDQYYREKRDKEKMELINRIKSLPAGSLLYFTGHDSKGRIKFGDKFEKVKDGRTYVYVWRNDSTWRIPYLQVIARECTEQEIRDRKLYEKMTKLFNDAINI